jgi:hypothetical protein
MYINHKTNGAVKLLQQTQDHSVIFADGLGGDHFTLPASEFFAQHREATRDEIDDFEAQHRAAPEEAADPAKASADRAEETLKAIAAVADRAENAAGRAEESHLLAKEQADKAKASAQNAATTTKTKT